MYFVHFQAESTAKSAMAIEKMVEGRLRKYYEDVVFMEQKFVVNDKLNVKVKSFFFSYLSHLYHHHLCPLPEAFGVFHSLSYLKHYCIDSLSARLIGISSC